jgi:biotin carboxyl carrier protein
LQQTGFISGAESDRVQYEWNAATSAEAAAPKRLEETKVEHDAVADGVFIGDSYNDGPSSIQRETELKMKKGELDAQLAGVRTQIKHITDQISEEEARYKLRSEATVALPVKGRVWEMLVGPGEFVNKGQDLLRVLDCSNPIVSANVDERVYNVSKSEVPQRFGRSRTAKPILGRSSI